MNRQRRSASLTPIPRSKYGSDVTYGNDGDHSVFVKVESPENDSTSPTCDNISPGGMNFSRNDKTMSAPINMSPNITTTSIRQQRSSKEQSSNRSPTSTTTNSPPSSSKSHPGSSTQKQLSKLKRFLATLQHFGNQISYETGERVRNLVYSLVSGSVSIETFHDQLQEATNFPLRPFVIPFLKNTLPLLQNDLFRTAKNHKLTPTQFLQQNEHFLMTSSAHSTSEHVDAPMDLNINGKRNIGERLIDSDKKKARVQPSQHRLSPVGFSPESFQGRLHADQLPHNKHPSFRQPMNGVPHNNRLSPNFVRFPPRLNSVDEPNNRATSASPRHSTMRRNHFNGSHRVHGFNEPRPTILQSRERHHTDRDWMEDCKQVDYLLTYIVDLVEKARQCIHILHRNFDSVHDDAVRWRRLYEDSEQFKRRPVEFIGETESRIPHTRKPTAEAIDFMESRRRMMAELDRAASGHESRTNEVLLVRRQESAFGRNNKSTETHGNCWNCGRRAQETCSGCNLARYCGSFCQHKDWENHHKVCGPDIKSRMESLANKRSAMKSPAEKAEDSAPDSPAPSTVTEKKEESPK